MLYDGFGRRVQKTYNGTTTTYVYDASGLATEYQNGSWLKDYVSDGAGDLIASENAAGGACTTCYYGGDHLGSTRLITNQAGSIVLRHDYLPYGEEIYANVAGGDTTFAIATSSDVTEKFTGQVRDQESSQDYFNARFFTPALGRFNSVDPTFSGSCPLDPQQWNRYTYVRSSPLSLTDPSGMFIAYPGTGGEPWPTDGEPEPFLDPYWPENFASFGPAVGSTGGGGSAKPFLPGRSTALKALANSDCAAAIGAASSQQAIDTLNATPIVYKNLGPLTGTEGPAGVTPIANGPPPSETNMSTIFINTNLNIVNPSNQSFLIQGTNQTVTADYAQAVANAVGAPSLSGTQFGALLILHELKHILTKDNQETNPAQYNTPIWEKCLKGLP